jgi:hypothetical protein
VLAEEHKGGPSRVQHRSRPTQRRTGFSMNDVGGQRCPLGSSPSSFRGQGVAEAGGKQLSILQIGLLLKTGEEIRSSSRSGPSSSQTC